MHLFAFEFVDGAGVFVCSIDGSFSIYDDLLGSNEYTLHDFPLCKLYTNST